MSEGKPTGADQSTSNGGGGGRTVDSGGGRENMSDGGGQIVNSGGGVNDGGDRGIADGSGGGETIQGGEGGENADAGGGGETMDSSVDGRTVDSGIGRGILDAGGQPADTAGDGQLVYGGGGIVDCDASGEPVNDVGGETTDSVGRSVNDVGGGGGTGHDTVDYGGGKQTVNDGGGGEVESSDGTMNLNSGDRGTIEIGGSSDTNNGGDGGTAESDTNETVDSGRRVVTMNGVGSTADGGGRGTVDGGGETTDNSNVGGELSKNGSRRVTGNEEGNTNDSTTPSQFGISVVDDTDDTWVNVETPDTNESSQRNLEKQGSASPPNLFGLQIRIKDEVSTYPLSRATGTLKMTDWLSVRKEESTSPHIRCYWLDDGKEEELPAFMSIFNSKSNVLLLVNNKDNFKIDAKFLCTIKAYDFPVAVVTCSVGQILEDLLQKHKREVQGRLEMSTVTTNFQDETKQEPPQGFQRVVQVITNFVKPSKPVVDLVTPVQDLLFPSDKEARIASEDPDLFQKVMAEFNNFENEDGNQTEINNALSMLVKNSEDSFRKDFPFYLAVAGRTFLRAALYRCDFVPTYWKTCIDRVESMDVDAITDTLKVFLRSGNFNISLNWKSYKEVQVLWCTQKAVLNLLKERRPLQPLQIYPVMLWITIYLKLNSSMLAQTSQGSFWSENFLKDAHRYKLCDANIRGVKDAILLGERLELPPEISFNARCIGELLVPCNGKKVRLFSHQREAICELGRFFKFENEFLQCVVVNLRGSYEASVKSKARGYINVLSSHGTELGAIKEGLGLLDAMNKVYNEKKWKMETFDNECQKWLLFLLGFVNYSQTPEISLHEFISSKHYTVTRRHQAFISVQVVKTTKVYLQKFSANQFFTLYQKFEIWPEKLLDEYLESTPKSITLSEEPMWTEFFSEATKRLPCASKQTCIHRFLLQIAEYYEEKKAAIDFVYDILKVEVPDLFAVESQNDEEAVTSFVQDLHTFIAQNQLKHKLLSNFKGVLMKLTKRSGRFQKIVLSAILKEIVPYPKDLQEMGFLPSWKHAVSAAVDNLKSNATWVEREPSVKQTFCLDFVNACCTLIKPSKNTFDWVEKYSTLIHQLGGIYCSYATKKNLTILLSTLPEDVTVNPSSAVKQYFLWIQNIHNILSTWKSNLNSSAANYDEIYGYIYKQQKIYEIAQHVSATEVVVSEENLTCLNTAYLEKFEELNILLLKYVPGDSKPYWCSLVSVLSEHGVWLPADLSDLLCESVLFPRQQNHGIKMVDQAPLPSITREFNPPSRTVKLRLSKTATLTVLDSLIDKVKEFVQPIAPYIDLLVYFKLHPNKIFNAYFQKEVELQSCKDQEGEEHVRLQVLKNALEHTVTLMERIMEGAATYGEIVAGGELSVLADGSQKSFVDSSFDVEEEFRNLVRCSQFRNYSTGGIHRIKCLLKLLQLPHYVKMINRVCRQYNLNNCQVDADFKKVQEFALKLQIKEERSRITPTDAEIIWEEVEKIFCLHEGASLKCLDIFSKVADSVDFYHFLEEKEFTGQNGEVLFGQQYDLVTAQLQHEEYNEMVLNHLYAAFKFISPFTDSGQTFNCLMSVVTSLDTREGLAQLDTVKKNMHLIRLWFSRAEDTLENVLHELDCIFKTGWYHFTFTVGGKNSVQLQLKYQAASVTKRHTQILKQESTLSVLTLGEEVEHSSPEKTELEAWSSEQITDFVRKLGFVESKEDEKRIHHFLLLNEIAHNLSDIYVKLKDLGHPLYLDQKFEDKLECLAPMSVAEKKVSEAQSVLTDWLTEVEQLHNSNKWLLFFRIPKLIMLHEALMSERCDVARIHQEIGLLFHRDETTRQKLHEALEHTMQTAMWKPVGNDLAPMNVVGSFLSSLLQVLNGEASHSLPMRYTDDFSQLSSSQTMPFSPPPEEKFVLHSALNFTQGELIELVLRIYGGPPEPFELLHCNMFTTEEEVKLFMKRVYQHPRQYLVLEFNHLPFQLQEVLLQLYIDFRHKQVQSSHKSTMHFIEVAPSILREIPWLRMVEHKKEELLQQSVGQKVQDICKNMKLQNDIGCIELVYGLPGDGKTHYIVEKLKGTHQSHQVTIAVNEAFSYMTAIEKLSSLPSDHNGCAIFFNFTVVPPLVSTQDTENTQYYDLMKKVGWFFFDLLVLGYVEDSSSGKSFYFPANLSWNLFIEVPSRYAAENPTENLKQFKTEVPVLGLLGTPVAIEHNSNFDVTDDVQLVCKYLKAHETERIDKLFKEEHPQDLNQFSTDPELEKEECQRLLCSFMPDHTKQNKITQKLFIHYMERRCRFLDNMPAFKYNPGVGEYVQTGETRYRTDTTKLGSTLMETMLREVADFCNPKIKESWTQKGHQQLIYDFKDGGASFGLISLLPDEIREEDKSKFVKIGVEIPSMMDLYTRSKLDTYLSRALNVPLSNGRLTPIDEQNYVLTLDFTIKMLNIYERYECGVPVIIEGETGVGKTALIEMLSKLINHSWVAQWEKTKDRILEIIKRKLGDIEANEVESYELCTETVHALSAGKSFSTDGLSVIAQLPPHGSGDEMFCAVLNHILLKLEGDPIFSMLELSLNPDETLTSVFDAVKVRENSELPQPEKTAHLLYVIFSAKIKSAFHKLNVHAALKPKQIKNFFKPVFMQAEDMQQAYSACDTANKPNFRVPFVTVYLDEINTCSCLGLFKEIITDRTLDGEAIPRNVFMIAACNPHRGDSLAVRGETTESWLKGTYYVHKLHPTLRFLMWEYGSLNKHQELEYVHAKMVMLNKDMSDSDVRSLTELIVESQEKMREYAFKQLRNLKVTDMLANVCAKSSVSQRDIQRVFSFYQWLMKLYAKFYAHDEDLHRRAVLVALGIVYFMRLTPTFRTDYMNFIDNFNRMEGEITFSQAYHDILEWFINYVELPPGIAKTNALEENVFAIIACTVTHTPLIIVGPPGSSKTLAFNIVTANLKGKESKVTIFRETDIFPSLDSHFYQCSRRTTSNEVEKVFMRAINRQRSLAKVLLPVYCVVFMDEAGLPEDKLESLKVLHYHLDKQEVSFVAISNDILDASKTNRAVSLFRPKTTDADLLVLAKSCVSSVGQSELETEQIRAFCESYKLILQDPEFYRMFGLRDFIHFATYFRRKNANLLDPQNVIQSLEMNFNGTKRSSDICRIFFPKIHSSEKCVHYRRTLYILKDVLDDCSCSDLDEVHASIQTEVRYKLIIDPSDDDSLVRLLFKYGVLRRDQTRLYICSDFPGDSHIMQVNTISQIRHSVAAGHTILMSQTDEIHESFYDLFNQRFRSIEDSKHGTRFYANIAIGAHSKPCRVDPKFQCVVVVRESELHQTPAPFLNRFEKYRLTHKEVLLTVKQRFSPWVNILLDKAYAKVDDFVRKVMQGQASFYGFTQETLDSLMLTLLPPIGHEYQQAPLKQNTVDEGMDKQVLLLKSLLDALQKNAGFHIPKYTDAELQSDADQLFATILGDREFRKLIALIHHGNALAVVDEALHVLFNESHLHEKDPPLEIYNDVCLVISLMAQWLVCYLCKRLLQLLTPEALIFHLNQIPKCYIQSYLQLQEHFSLKNLVAKQFKKLEENQWNLSVCATKLLCFTRSSPFIRQLPLEFPRAIVTTPLVKDPDTLLKEHVFFETHLLMMCKVSAQHSQSKLEKLLDDFVKSNRCLLLLTANMQEVTKKMVNHLRVIVEEAESRIKNTSKLFVLLLHFPPAMFFNPCYSSLFLQGWDHYYLDSITPATLTKGAEIRTVVDINEWFQQCCCSGYKSRQHDPRQHDPILTALTYMLGDAVPVIASRLVLKDDLFHGSINGSQRTGVIKDLLLNKVGTALSHRFTEYWNPRTMLELLQKVTRFTHIQKSTLNITDAIQTTFKSLFFDFLVYMLAKINEDHNLNIILENDCTPTTSELFLNLLQTVPAPDLRSLQVLSATVRTPQGSDYLPKFPFFKYVCGTVDKYISESTEKVHQKTWPSLLQETVDQQSTETSITTAEHSPLSSTVQEHKSKQSMEGMYCEVVKSQIKGSESCLEIVAKAMQSDDSLWTHYCEDFIWYKLHLFPEKTLFIQDILHLYIGSDVLDCTNALSKLVSLHVRFHVHQLDIVKVMKVLKPISKLESMSSPLMPNPIVGLKSVVSPVDTVDKKRLPNISSFIVTMLFEAFSEAASKDELTQWHRSYFSVISVPSLEENIVGGLTPATEPQLNIMHATYLLMQCCAESSAADVAKQFYSKFFSEESLSKGMCPRLKELAEMGIDLLTVTENTKPKESQCVRSYLDGLFAFFFSVQRTEINNDDCKWFLEVANLHARFSVTQAVAADDCTSPHANWPSLNVFKLYLSRILGNADISKEQLFNSQRREMIVQVLMSQGVSGLPGPYIPTFYHHQRHIRSCVTPENTLMQQPLAHLYFLTVLEQLQAKACSMRVNFLIRRASKYSEQCTSGTTLDTVLRFIEKQAVVQVLIQQLVSFFDPKNPEKIQDLFSTGLAPEVNDLLKDESMGGGCSDVSGHGLVIALHLQRQLKSNSKLIQLLSDDQSTLVKHIQCVKPLQTLIQNQPKDEAHLFPFIHPEKNVSDLGEFYQQIHEILVEVHSISKGSQHSQESINRLVSLAQKSHSGSAMIKLKDGVFINKWNAFQMLMWLCAYYNFFCVRKNHSKFLADTIGTSLRGLLDDQVICLLQSFIYPKEMMIKRVENPPLLDENAQRFVLTKDLQFMPVQQQSAGNKTDPISELFNPPADAKEDRSDIGLRHAMANMVAAILACPPRSNHLWYHLFAANELNHTHVTGFMFEGKITKDRLYDCGVEFSPDGTYGRPDYIPHATRGTLSLQSLYLLLWANFGAFCMALITQPDGHERISGPVISSWQHIRHYCVSQLRSLWWHMSNSLQLSTEEQSFFIMKCMLALIEEGPQIFHQGKLLSAEELDAYETLWHKHIFCHSNIHDEYSTYCQVWENALLKNLSVLETHFPHFATEEEFLQTMLSSVNASDVKNPHYVLSKFALVYPRLKAGGALLPDLIEFYQWIHTELAYLVTHNYAQNHSLEEVITKADKKYEGLDLCQLYERVKDGYNKYVEVVGGSIGAGACANGNRSGKIYKIDHDTLMLHLLSEKRDVGEANDWLYIVIDDIVNFHNGFLQDLFRAIASPEQSHVRKCFPEHLEEHVYPTEVDSDVCIVAKSVGYKEISEHLQLIRSRYFLPHERKDNVLDEEKLQEDVIKTYLVGKPLIHDPAEHLHVSFKFGVVRAEPIAMGVSTTDLEHLSNYITDVFKLPLETAYKKALELQFHTADYHLLTEVALGLRNATEHLSKRLNLQNLPDETKLQQMTLQTFLFTLFGKQENGEGEDKKLEMEILQEIGMQSLSQPGCESQLACLLALKLPYLYSTLELFVHWIQDGIYDFHHLPLVMKIHLEDRDIEKLQEVIGKYDGTAEHLQDELSTLTNVLMHAESYVRKTIAENVQKPITTFLTELQFVGDEDILPRMIPESVLCQNYVDLRLQLRRLTSVVQQKVSALKRGESTSESTWDELVTEIWEENGLKHLRDAATPFQHEEVFTYDPRKGTYAFQEGYEVNEEEDAFVFIDQRDHDELANQLMQVQPAKEEPKPPVPSSTEETSQPYEPELKKMASRLTVDDVTKFLKEIKLQDLVGLFHDNDVDGELLIELSDDDLKGLGVRNPFHRQKISIKFKTHVRKLIEMQKQ